MSQNLEFTSQSRGI